MMTKIKSAEIKDAKPKMNLGLEGSWGKKIIDLALVFED